MKNGIKSGESTVLILKLFKKYLQGCEYFMESHYARLQTYFLNNFILI